MERSSLLGNGCNPFTTVRPRRIFASVKPHALRQAKAQISERQNAASIQKLSGLGIGSFFFQRPAWAEDAAAELSQKASELSSSLPTPEAASDAVQKSGGSALDLFSDNPILLGGLALLAAIPFVFKFIQGGALGVKQVNAAGAVEGLTSDPGTVLVDIRSKEEIKEQGAPNLSSTKKKAILVPFTQVVGGEVEENESFAETFGKVKQITPESSIILLDSFGKEAPQAAKLLATAVDRVYFVTDGAIGPTGWKESGQPWKEPGQNFFSGFSLDNLAEDFKAQPTFAKAGLAAGALGLASAVLFQEVGTAVELAAVAAAGAFVVPRFTGGKSSSTSLPDPTSETTKKQVKDFVKESSKDPAKSASKAEQGLEKKARQAAGKVQSATSDAKSEAKSVIDSGDTSSVKSKGSKTQDKAEDKLEEVSQDVQEGVTDAAEQAQKSTEEAKEWIENWKTDQPKK